MFSSKPRMSSFAAGSYLTEKSCLTSSLANSASRRDFKGAYRQHLVRAVYTQSTPGDFLFFPTRVVAGLVAETLSSDQPIRLPQNLEDFNAATAAWAQKGKVIEAETLETVAALLPQQAQVLLQPFRSELSSFSSSNQSPAIDVAAYPTATTTPSAADPSQIKSQQIAAELASVKTSVSRVNETTRALLTATDAAEVPMLRLNLREARDILQRRMEQLSSSSASGISSEAVDDASILLADLDLVV